MAGKHPERCLLENSHISNNPSSSINRCRHSPGVLVTSLNSSKSKSKVGGWCCRGQLDTAAVSCSSRMIQTSIRPGKQKADLSETQISIMKNPPKIPVKTSYKWQGALGWQSSLSIALSAYERWRWGNVVWQSQRKTQDSNSPLTPHFKPGNSICKFYTEMTVRWLGSSSNDNKNIKLSVLFPICPLAFPCKTC